MIRTLRIISILLIFLLFLLPVVHSQSDQLERVIQNLNSEYRDLRMSAVWTLSKVKDPRAVAALVAALKHDDLLVRAKAAEALGEIKDQKAVEPLIVVLSDKEDIVRESATNALKNITGKDFGLDTDKWKKWWQQNKKDTRTK